MSHAMLAIATYLATTGVVEGLGPSKMVQTRKPFAGVNATDVVAVMAMGDSWMTGFNAPGYSRPFELQKVSNDYRGGAWTTGDGIVAPGARPVETLATLLRRYNPALAGVSSGMTPMREPCVVKPRECGLNAAVDGATLPTDGEPGQRAHPNTLLQQAVDLCQWVRTRYPPAVQEGWKVLTVLASWGDQFWTPRNARKQGEELRRALEKLRADMPGRTYVNILAFSEHPSSLTRVHEQSRWCKFQMTTWQRTLSGGASNSVDGADEYAIAMNRELLAAAEALDSPESGFVVRLQPVLRGFRFRLDLADGFTCMHPAPSITPALSLGLLQNMAARSANEALSALPAYGTDEGRRAAEVMGTFERVVQSAARGRSLVLR